MGQADQYKAIVIGASAGGLTAVSYLLENLRADFTLPVIVVIHLPADKHSVMARILDGRCALSVKEVSDKDDIEAGTIYIAPPNYHVLVETDHILSLSTDEPVLYSRPSIDVLFESAADAYEDGLLGIILTGANADGANGLKTIIEKGGDGLVQTPDEAEAPQMPEAAIKLCPGVSVKNLENISSYLKNIE